MSGPVTLITGAYGALGRSVTACFNARGAQVAAVDVPASPPAEIAESVKLALGGRDLTKPDVASQCVADVVAALGGVDVVINIAGGFGWEKVQDGTLDTWRAMFELNTATAANMCKAAIPALLKSNRARIINVGAGAALLARTGMGAYAASKSGVHNLTQALADELKGSVTVNAVLPSIIDTPQNRKDMPNENFGTWVRPQEIADVMWFLASLEASGVTGALIPVPGRV